jgi:hypothetical protein
MGDSASVAHADARLAWSCPFSCSASASTARSASPCVGPTAARSRCNAASMAPAARPPVTRGVPSCSLLAKLLALRALLAKLGLQFC